VSWKVIDLNDEIELINHSHQTVVVYAYATTPPLGPNYSGGEYARILGNGTVQLNEKLARLLPQPELLHWRRGRPRPLPPRRRRRTGSRSQDGHSLLARPPYSLTTSPIVPPFRSKTRRPASQLVFDWYVPIQVGSTKGYLYGQLFWDAEKSFSFPIGAIIAFIVVVIVGAALVIVVRRRRGGAPPRRLGERPAVHGAALAFALLLFARRFPVSAS